MARCHRQCSWQPTHAGQTEKFNRAFSDGKKTPKIPPISGFILVGRRIANQGKRVGAFRPPPSFLRTRQPQPNATPRNTSTERNNAAAALLHDHDLVLGASQPTACMTVLRGLSMVLMSLAVLSGPFSASVAQTNPAASPISMTPDS